MKKIIDNYVNGDLNILMLNSKYNGAGINLPTTTDIIIYHRLNKELEKQVVGRALRLGRPLDSKLVIHNLLYPGE